jgi:hypothetical protein
MKHTLLVFLLVNLMLSACAPVSAPTSTPAPSATPLPTATATPTSIATPTSTPTATPTVTPTPIPTIQVGNLSVPDPRVTNPELFDLRNPDAPIPQFVNAMKMAGIEITAEQVAQGITYKALKDKDGNPFVVAVYNLDPSLFPKKYIDLAVPIPLLIAKKGERGWEWKENQLTYSRNSVGTDAVGWYMLQNHRYEQAVISDSNCIDIDTIGVWSVLEPQRGQRNTREWNKMVYAVEVAHKRNIPYSLGPIINGSLSIPDWLKQIRNASEALSSAKNHISEIAREFGRDPLLNRVTVANEMLPHLLGQTNFWTEELGINRDYFLQEIFRHARNEFGDTKLGIRDFSIEFAGYPRADQMYEMIKRLNEEERQINGRNLIDVVEFQLPLFLPNLVNKDPAMNPNNFSTPEKYQKMLFRFRENIIRYKQIGVEVQVTEFFVADNPMINDYDRARIYHDIAKICAEENITLIFYRNADSNNTFFAYPNTDMRIHLRNEQLQPKLYYYVVLSAMFGF